MIKQKSGCGSNQTGSKCMFWEYSELAKIISVFQIYFMEQFIIKQTNKCNTYLAILTSEVVPSSSAPSFSKAAVKEQCLVMLLITVEY